MCKNMQKPWVFEAIDFIGANAMSIKTRPLTGAVTMFLASVYSKNTCIYAVFSMLQEVFLPRHKNIVEGSLEVKLPTIWTDEEQSRAEAERRERLEERRSEEKESEERRCRCVKR